MGTNYYAEYDGCHECQRADRIHIGKSGPILAAHDDPRIRSWADWKQWLRTRADLVTDEYGTDMTVDQLISIFEATSFEERRRQYDWQQRQDRTPIIAYDSWLDADGFTMTPGEWS